MYLKFFLKIRTLFPPNFDFNLEIKTLKKKIFLMALILRRS